MVVRRIGPASAAKLGGVLYGLMGLLFGLLFAAVSLVAGSAIAGETEGNPLMGALFGVGAIVIMPLMYGAMGLLGGLIGAALYNLCAGMIGGLDLEVE
jgi:hypothetical protein